MIETDWAARLFWALATPPGDKRAAAEITDLGYVESANRALAGDSAAMLGNEAAMSILKARLNAGVPIEEAAGLSASFRFVVPADEEYPAERLARMEEPPHGLFMQGEGGWLLGNGGLENICITGTRACTHYGQIIAADLAQAIVGRGGLLVTGGSFGIETAALRGSLAAGGRPVLVNSAGGVDPYPAANVDLFGAMTQSTIVSERRPGTRPTRAALVRRMKLMAAMSDVVIVVEGGEQSTLTRVSARYGQEIGLPIGAVPGPVTSAASKLPHQLIVGGAQLVTPENVVELFCSSQEKEEML